MATKTLKFDCYQVHMPQNTVVTFEAVLNTVNAFQGTARVHHTQDYPIRLQFLEQRPDYYIGDIAKIRMTDIPLKMRTSGETEEIDLDADQGLGEVASFLFCPRISVLVIQRNRNAVTATGVAHYFQHKGIIERELIFTPILQAEAYQRIANLNQYQKLELEVAAPGNAQIFRDAGMAPEAVINLMGAAPRVTISCTLSTGHDRQGSLLRDRVIELVGSVLRRPINPGESVKLIVSGKNNPDDAKETIDLFEEMMVTSEPVNIGNARNLSDDLRRAALIRAWGQKRDELFRIFQTA